MTRPSWIGQILNGRYRIDDLLGQGGMSAVYKAYDPNLKRTVALKMIHAHLADDPKFVVRFTEEAAAVAKLRHPNIVQVFDFNNEGDTYYMVQEFLEGETLQERLRRLNKNGQRMPLSEAIGYILNICDAAGYAHQRGLIHRDIKPANIMLDQHGQAILMDFGIVKIAGGEKHTETGAVVGTALYMPPELVVGETPNPRSDEYSLAITLFEALSGRPPFEADSAMTLMMMHLNNPVPDLRELRSDVPPGLVQVITKALSKKPEQRYASMAEFAGALRGVLATLDKAALAATLADPLGAQRTLPSVDATSPNGFSEGETNVEPPALAFSPPVNSLAINPPIGSEAALPRSEKPADRLGQELKAAVLPAPRPASSSGSAKMPPRPSLLLWVGGIGAVFVVLLGMGIAGALLLRNIDRGNQTPLLAALPSMTPTATLPVDLPPPTVLPSPTSAPTITPTLPPTATPTITLTPTPTIPVGVPYSRINGITINAAGIYVVDYETFEYTEQVPGLHVHFFFNTVPPDQAGMPGQGPWKLYGGPRPFEGYRTSDRPQAATQMCILVANADHSVQPDSGNCVFLPDVQVAVPFFAEPCLAGPDPAYAVLAQLSAGQVLRVLGISPDEVWWSVEHPNEPGNTCWIERSRSSFSGDLSLLPLAEVPPPPVSVSVQITNITLDDRSRYVVEFTPLGFTPALPGTHIHFFFDTYLANQTVAVGGKRLMFGGISPFTDYTTADRPPDAKQLCALVANPDHTVIDGSGNCLALP